MTKPEFDSLRPGDVIVNLRTSWRYEVYENRIANEGKLMTVSRDEEVPGLGVQLAVFSEHDFDEFKLIKRAPSRDEIHDILGYDESKLHESEAYGMADDSINSITPIHSGPARGLDYLESKGRVFHVVNASSCSAEDLADSFDGLLVNGGNWHPDHVVDQANVLANGGNEIRVVFRNLHLIDDDLCYELERLVKNEEKHPIKSLWFVDDGGEIPDNIRHKVLMRGKLVDSPTLLDSIAFGWGSKNPYTGSPVTPDVDLENDF
jgi:hypothetical protein